MSQIDRRREHLIETYRKKAKHYDITSRLYPAPGYPQRAQRLRAVQALGLRAGDSVIDIACGTGLNFPLIEEVIGPGGRIVGVDLTDAMLTHAQDRIETNGWSNISLVQADAADFDFPARAPSGPCVRPGGWRSFGVVGRPRRGLGRRQPALQLGVLGLRRLRAGGASAPAPSRLGSEEGGVQRDVADVAAGQAQVREPVGVEPVGVRRRGEDARARSRRAAPRPGTGTATTKRMRRRNAWSMPWRMLVVRIARPRYDSIRCSR